MELQERLGAYEQSKLQERLALFRGMINCNSPFYIWEYGEELELLNSNCPDEHFLDILFTKSDYIANVQKNDWEERRALLVGGVAGIMWGAVRDGAGHFHVVGPVLSSETSAKDISELTMQAYNMTMRAAGAEWAQAFPQMVITHMRGLPIVPVGEFCKIIAMLYYCVHLEPIRYSDVTYQIAPDRGRQREPSTRDRHRTWMAEQALLGMVRNGDVDYHSALSQAAAVSRGVPLQNSDHLRQAKISSQVFASLCTRAAIEGGLSPEQAYSVGDSYIQQVEDCKNVSEILGVANTMYDDFINRVHSQMMDPRLPRQIRDCMDYISGHLGDKLTVADLASRAGYSESSLTHRFKQETGMTIGEYIKATRVEKAKLLLISTDDPLPQIARELGFCGPSHFSRVFLQVMGVRPDEYRKKNRA